MTVRGALRDGGVVAVVVVRVALVFLDLDRAMVGADDDDYYRFCFVEQ